MPITEYFGWTTPTVDGSDSTWGDTLNDRINDLDALLAGVTELSGISPTIDLSTDVTTFTLTTSGNTNFTFNNPNTTGSATYFSLFVTAGGTHTLTWPGSVQWSGGIASPAPASGDTDAFAFVTVDGGGVWYGFKAGDDLN